MRICQRFYDLGFNVLTPLLQAHKPSEGRYISMGRKDKDNIFEWIEWILRKDNQAQILLFGVSMKASTAMMACADAPESVKGIIEDCGYADVKSEFDFQMQSLFGIPSFLILQICSMINFLKQGFFFSSASCSRQLAKCRVPVLFIHGNRDGFVPFEMLERCYAACACKSKRKVVFDGARHGEAVYKDADLYWNSITDFVHDLCRDWKHREGICFDFKKES